MFLAPDVSSDESKLFFTFRLLVPIPLWRIKLKQEVALHSISFGINQGLSKKDTNICIKFLKAKISSQYGTT